MPSKKPDPRNRNFAVNRQASHLYHFLDRFEAGIELQGTEVKSVREGRVNIKDGYAVVRNGEVFLCDCHVGEYGAGSYLNHAPLRERRLLLHRREIDHLTGRTEEKGLTLVPLRLYLKDNRIKVEIALAKGKKIYDHREASRRRVIEREALQDMRDHQKRWKA